MFMQTQYTWYTTPKYQYWLKAILWQFKKNPSDTWTHPPTSIGTSDLFNFLLCKAPDGSSRKFGKKVPVTTSYFQLGWKVIFCHF